MKSKNTNQELIGPDGGWGWMVVLGSFIIQFMTTGLVQSLSPLFIDLRRYFESSAEATSWIFSILPCIVFSGGFLGAFLTKMVGHRIAIMIGGVLGFLGFFISYFAPTLKFLYGSVGVLSGVGLAVSLPPSFEMLAIYFPTKHALVNGIAISGCGFCMIILPPILQACLQKFGWRASMLILSAICAHVTIGGALMRPVVMYARPKTKTDDHDYNDNATEKVQSKKQKPSCGCLYVLRLLFCDYLRLTLLSLSFTCTTSGLLGSVVHMQSRANVMRVSTLQQTAWLVSVLGLTGFIGRAGGGIIVQRKIISATNFYILSIFVVGVALMIPYFALSYAGFVALIAIVGLGSGVYMSVCIVCIKEYVGGKNFLSAMPILLCPAGIAVLLGPPLAGYIYDVTGNYDNSFYALGCLHLIGGLICIPGQYVTWMKNKKIKNSKSNINDNEDLNLPLRGFTDVAVNTEVVMRDAVIQTYDTKLVHASDVNTVWISNSHSDLGSPIFTEYHSGEE